jgi:hypothetical protein
MANKSKSREEWRELGWKIFRVRDFWIVPNGIQHSLLWVMNWSEEIFY